MHSILVIVCIAVAIAVLLSKAIRYGWKFLRDFYLKRLFVAAEKQIELENWSKAEMLWKQFFRFGGEGAQARYYFALSSRRLANLLEDTEKKIHFLDESIAQLSFLEENGVNPPILCLNFGDTLLERSSFASGEERITYWQQAEQCYDAALKADPSMAPAWGNKGTLLLTWGRHATGAERNDLWQRAEDCYQRATSLDENAATVWAHLGRLAWMQADFTVGESRMKLWVKAEKCYDTAIRLDPELQTAREDRASLLIERAAHSTASPSPARH